MSVTTEQQVKYLQERLWKLLAEVDQVVLGQHDTIKLVLSAMLAGGHALLEGVPGLAKTLLVKTLAQAMQMDFNRIQFTPDLMPSDIIGTEVIRQLPGGNLEVEFRPGPVFTNLLLADEINRTPPKTQAALLEAMQERAITYAGNTYPLPSPFFLLATQNPIEQSGTYPLPEAQLDRFLLYLKMEYPAQEAELEVLRQTATESFYEPAPVMNRDDFLAAQACVQKIAVDESLIAWIHRCMLESRPQSTTHKSIKRWVQWGAGTRAGQAWLRVAKAHAFLSGRYSLAQEDLLFVALPVLRHRFVLNFEAQAENISVDDLILEIINAS
ncbi:MAG: ATPase AAA [Thermonema sp.]|uniref:AAA family ATPase n=1 Tax=Thermonema TaxID=28194 RepID=UPI00056DF013|nr:MULTISPECIES: MoxR family ATPase [Thermonema]GIV40187.1 MAG: ATPase AAA [Thermonema sp.]